jgi:hypothetical protein
MLEPNGQLVVVCKSEQISLSHLDRVAVIPRKFPEPVAPADWADKHAQQLTGQAPKSAGKEDPSPNSAGDPAAGPITNLSPVIPYTFLFDLNCSRLGFLRQW